MTRFGYVIAKLFRAYTDSGKYDSIYDTRNL